MRQLLLKPPGLVRELFNVPEGYAIVFLQGGASLQFDMVPYNLLNENETAVYLKTGGAWQAAQ